MLELARFTRGRAAVPVGSPAGVAACLGTAALPAGARRLFAPSCPDRPHSIAIPAVGRSADPHHLAGAVRYRRRLAAPAVPAAGAVNGGEPRLRTTIVGALGAPLPGAHAADPAGVPLQEID